jgi:hypothetical protein
VPILQGLEAFFAPKVNAELTPRYNAIEEPALTGNGPQF